MNNIDISYQSNIFKARLTRERAFPNDLFKVEFENLELLRIIESPIWIEEKGKFIHLNT